ncbi:Transcriptional regulator, ArsR family [Mycetocola reblochoni REB411]|uniref:Transcriptional regulator, ArsR family n=1 Tax=Mycetocola reblochoni REB411 TaxID=1255698 RepID=A0A1R4IK51_9MICO|nr:Transcriptional regulator, ArsR family [Mycetocola reblochoni REB411]
MAEYIDEAPGTLSYHLGTLSAAGLITEHKQEGRDRRERWWQAANATTSWDETSSSALSRQVMQLYAQQYEHYLDTASTLSDDWRAAGNTSDRVLRLTSREAAELSAELTGLLQRWAERSADADAAPAAANGSDSREPVFVLIQSYSLQS